MGEISISVIMSVYNTREDWLREAVESILNQSFSDFEFIIITDAPTDGSGDIIKEYQTKDSRIRLIENCKNEGLTKNLNKGLAIAKGKYLARMDADDVAEPDRLEIEYRYLEEHPRTAAVGSYMGAYENGRLKRILMHECPNDLERERVRLLFRNAGIGHPTAMIRADFLKRHGIKYDERLVKSQDYGLWVAIIDARGRIDVLPVILVKYRIHPNQITASGVQKYVKIVLYDQLSKLIDSVTERDLDICFNYGNPKSEYTYSEYCEFLCRVENGNKVRNYCDAQILKEELLWIWIVVAIRKREIIRLFSTSPLGTGVNATTRIIIRKMIEKTKKKTVLIKYRIRL